MKRKGLLSFLLFKALVVLLVSCTIVRHDNVASGSATSDDQRIFGFGARDFIHDPQQFAEAIWEPVVIPRIESMAVDFLELMAALESDENAASRRYGFRLLDEGNLFNFAVKGQVRIFSVDTSSQSGTASLDFAPFDGNPDALMSIGPVFRNTNTAVRDIQDTISINDFRNQREFAHLARELNNKVRDTVVNDIDFARHIGEEMEIIGAFTYSGRGSTVEIVPVRISFIPE